MQSLTLKALLSTPRDQIAANDQLVLPIASTVFGAVHTWPGYTPLLAYDLLVKYHTPTEHNMMAATMKIGVPHLVCLTSQQFRIYNTIESLDSGGFYSTQSGRDLLLAITRNSQTPHTDRRFNSGPSTGFINTPFFRECTDAVAEVARTSFAYDGERNCITVNYRDVRRIAGAGD